MTKISVIIPVYNTESYLRKCLDSIVNQTLKDIEIICVNDCSPDDSLKILKEYAANDNRIKIIDFKENKGVGIARNEALKIAHGEYIGFVDPDDWIDLDFYEKLYNKAIETDSDLVKTNFKRNYIDKPEVINPINILPFNCGIYKNNFIFENNIRFLTECICGEDQIFIAKTELLTNKKNYIDNTYYHYFQRKGSASYETQKDEKHFASDLQAFEEVLFFITDNVSKIIDFDKMNFILLEIVNYTKRLNLEQTKSFLAMVKKYSKQILNIRNLDSDNIQIYNLIKEEKDVTQTLNSIYSKRLLKKLRENLKSNS